MAVGVSEVVGGTRVFISDSLADNAEPVYFTPGGQGVTIVDSRIQAERIVRIVSGPDPRVRRKEPLLSSGLKAWMVICSLAVAAFAFFTLFTTGNFLAFLMVLLVTPIAGPVGGLFAWAMARLIFR